jgi:hypothetical protein
LPLPGLLLLLESDLSNLDSRSRIGFAWLVAASVLLMLRCLFDLTLVRRPALAPNLSAGGLAWLACALFGSLMAVAVRQPQEEGDKGDKNPPPLTRRVQDEGESIVQAPNARLWVARTLAVACHLAVVVGLVVVGWRHFQDAHAGMAVATFYLLLPYTFLFLPHSNVLDGHWYDVWPTALLVWAVAAYRRPTLSGLLLGLAAGSVYFPLLLFPLWLSFYWRAGRGRFAAAFLVGVGLTLAWLGALAWFRGEGLWAVLPMTGREWLPWLPPPRDTTSLWAGVGWMYRLPVFVAYLGLVLASAFWPGPRTLSHLIALSAALLIGTQLWYADLGGTRLLWYLPLLLLLAFRPNLSTALAPPINPETDWLVRVRRTARRFFTWLLGLTGPPVKVP